MPEPFHGLTDVLRSYYALDTQPPRDVSSIDVSSPAISRIPPEDADSDPRWAVRAAWLDERRGSYIFLRVPSSITQVTLPRSYTRDVTLVKMTFVSSIRRNDSMDRHHGNQGYTLLSNSFSLDGQRGVKRCTRVTALGRCKGVCCYL